MPRTIYQNNEIRTIFSKNRSNGAYGAFSVGYSRIDGNDAIISGGRAAFIFDHSLAIGLGGYGFVNNLNSHQYYGSNSNHEMSLAGGYGGLLIEPIVTGRNPVHLSFPILAGVGGVSVVDVYNWEYWGTYEPWNDYNYDFYFVIEPAVELEFNLAKFFRTALYASYRYTSRVELYQTSEYVLRGFNFGATFKFGKF